MNPLFVLIAVGCGALFYRAAEYERMSPLVWGLSSVALTFAVSFMTPSMLAVLAAQVALFIVMWWYNVKRSSPPSG